MTREEAKKEAEVMLAYAEGKEIEVRSRHESLWREAEKPGFDWEYFEFRIKPSPKYRPFKDAEECWNEMLKHQPFGWVKDKRDNEIIMITSVCSRACIIGKYTKDFKEVLDCYTFADGSVFGIKEEE